MEGIDNSQRTWGQGSPTWERGERDTSENSLITTMPEISMGGKWKGERE